MRRYLLVLLFVIVPLVLKAQSITGKVMRMGTKNVIANASIYFSGSVRGTTTDSLGAFKITVTQLKIPIIVSCVGYFSATVTDYKADEPVMVYLKPKENIMREVQIGYDGMSQAAKVRLFKEEFLGKSYPALSCTIVNINDIDLTYDQKTEKLTAFCSKPIIVKNKMLGYTLTYYLDNFSREQGHVVYAGNYMFKEDSVTDVKELKKIKRNRENVYSDSRMHFIRALWSRTLDVAGFSMFDDLYQKISDQDILFANAQDDKFIILKGSIRITYRNNYRDITILSQKEKFSYIDKFGYYGMGLSWAGVMSAQRIGDMLPFEYVSPIDEVRKPTLAKP